MNFLTGGEDLVPDTTSRKGGFLLSGFASLFTKKKGGQGEKPRKDVMLLNKTRRKNSTGKGPVGENISFEINRVGVSLNRWEKNN